MALEPFDLNGPAFLALYATLFVAAIITSVMLPRLIRAQGLDSHRPGEDALAFLGGGTSRLAETMVTRLMAEAKLVLDANNQFRALTHEGANADENRILHLPAPIRWSVIMAALRPYAEAIETRLAQAGLIYDHAATRRLRLIQTLPYLLLIGFGACKLIIGIERGKPITFLLLFLAVTTVFALIRWAVVDRRTRSAARLLSEARAREDRLRRAPTRRESATAVALFGTTVLVASEFAPFHKLRAASGDGGSAVSGGDDGGGGCGSSGCGGCGGS